VRSAGLTGDLVGGPLGLLGVAEELGSHDAEIRDLREQLRDIQRRVDRVYSFGWVLLAGMVGDLVAKMLAHVWH